MLNSVIAEEFIGNLEQFSDYEISIMDLSGNILYSTNKHRIQYKDINFDEISFTNIEMIEFRIDNKDGVIVPLLMDHELAAFIAIVGSIQEIRPISKILKMAMEIRIKYEETQIKEKETLSIKECLISELINYNAYNDEKIKKLFEKGCYDYSLPRIIIVFCPNQKSFSRNLINTNFYYDSKEDIVAVYNEAVVVLKDCANVLKINYNNYGIYINKYISFIKGNTIFTGNIFVSQPQADYKKYCYNYKQINWLIKNFMFFINVKENGVFFLKDYLDLYLVTNINREVFDSIYEPILKNSRDFDKKEFMSIIKIIINNNYNLTQSSKDLFMHKNTLIYKMEKLKRTFNIDPINIEADRCFLKNLYYYILINDFEKGDEDVR